MGGKIKTAAGKVVFWRFPRLVTFFYSFVALSIVSGFLTASIIARFLSGEDFTIFYDTISQLGVPADNPDGDIWFGIALVSLAVFLYPIYMFSYKRSLPYAKKFASIALVLYFLACLGTIGVAVFPTNGDFEGTHLFFATLAFIGLLVPLLILLPLSLIVDRHRPSLGMSRIAHIIIIVATLALWGLAIMMIVTNLIDNTSGVLFIRFALWEWLAGLSLFVYLPLLVALAPRLHIRQPSLDEVPGRCVTGDILGFDSLARVRADADDPNHPPEHPVMPQMPVMPVLSASDSQ
eukprot:gnl/Dysnectes_brevis/6620_a10420_461.p1 GENE.gnl/Dysnectes_brevis/6620_a10420_461~~gnl/Dysnectes_brevis/6620_a10420_461.p1  ORF type:complete len:292 (+),score=49.50 gnl/Dysnectes_brevis/6620_a10420_461:48-923(+)